MEEKRYQDYNSETIDRWVEEGWEWGQPISHDVYEKAKAGEWDVLLTPTRPVPHSWFGESLKGKKVLGLACGGGQQMPVFAALGAIGTVLDYSERMLAQDRLTAEREGYPIRIVRADMTQPLPFEDGEFDLIFHPVSNCYVEEIESIWIECFRVLKSGGRLLVGFDNGINYLFDENDESRVVGYLPYNPLKNEAQRREAIEGDYGYQFSHTIEEEIGGQLRAGFRLTDIFEDTNGEGILHEHGVPCFYATLAIKP